MADKIVNLNESTRGMDLADDEEIMEIINKANPLVQRDEKSLQDVIEEIDNNQYGQGFSGSMKKVLGVISQYVNVDLVQSADQIDIGDHIKNLGKLQKELKRKMTLLKEDSEKANSQVNDYNSEISQTKVYLSTLDDQIKVLEKDIKKVSFSVGSKNKEDQEKLYSWMLKSEQHLEDLQQDYSFDKKLLDKLEYGQSEFSYAKRQIDYLSKILNANIRSIPRQIARLELASRGLNRVHSIKAIAMYDVQKTQGLNLVDKVYDASDETIKKYNSAKDFNDSLSAQKAHTEKTKKRIMPKW